MGGSSFGYAVSTNDHSETEVELNEALNQSAARRCEHRLFFAALSASGRVQCRHDAPIHEFRPAAAVHTPPLYGASPGLEVSRGGLP